jgi:hypothetical protein
METYSVPYEKVDTYCTYYAAYEKVETYSTAWEKVVTYSAAYGKVETYSTAWEKVVTYSTLLHMGRWKPQINNTVGATPLACPL